MLQQFAQDSIALPGKRDIFTICDMPGFAEIAAKVPSDMEERKSCTKGNHWFGCKDFDVALNQCIAGDLSNVAASDKIMSEIEHSIPLTSMWRNRLDVVGGVPCVPAYLAGQPMNMRRRERVAVEQGPLAIFVTTTVSASMSADDMRKRGAAMLALVRLLSNSRPVELWACNSVGETGFASHVLVRIDTAPLDLARAAHMLTDVAVTRGLGYGVARANADANNAYWHGGWGYGNQKTFRDNARQVYIAAINPSAEALLIPAAHESDPAVKNPVQWLKDMLAQYGGIESEAA